MRSFHMKSAVAIVAGLVTLAASAPASQLISKLECHGTTVTALFTVTIHDAPTTTVNLTPSTSDVGQNGDLSTTTLSHIYTSTRTTTVYLSAVASSSVDQDSNLPTTTVTHYYTSTLTTTVAPPKSYETTVTQTLVVATVYKTYATMPSPSVTEHLSFVVVSGTTSWVGGIAPPSSVSYVVVTSAVTVVPVITPVSLNHTRTTTLHSTVFSTKKTTITKSLPDHTLTNSLITLSTTAGVSWTRTSAGWNSSSLNASFGFGSGFTQPATSQSVFITEQSSYDLYGTRSSEHLTATAAKSGFTANPADTTSTANAVWTTSVSSGRYASSFNRGSTSGSYTNVVSSDSNLTVSASSTQSADKVFSGSASTAYVTPASTSSFWTTQSAIGTASSTMQSSSSCSSDFFTSTAIGEFTSSSSLSSPTPIYAPAPSPSSSDVATSSAIGIFTSLSSSFLPSAISTESILSNSPSATQTSTTCSSSALATPTHCGEIGDFNLNFDDIPQLVATNDTSNTTQPMPLFSPYHLFDFSEGFAIVPQSKYPYFPSSKPLLVEFIPNVNVVQSISSGNEHGYSGAIGNGDHGVTGCFGFNFYGAAFGCDSQGPDCDFTFTGFKYDPGTETTNQVAKQKHAFPACSGLLDCDLTSVEFTNEFMNIDTIRIMVTVNSKPKVWWMDDLKLGWFNNTCSAGLCRISTPIY